MGASGTRDSLQRARTERVNLRGDEAYAPAWTSRCAGRRPASRRMRMCSSYRSLRAGGLRRPL